LTSQVYEIKFKTNKLNNPRNGGEGAKEVSVYVLPRNNIVKVCQPMSFSDKRSEKFSLLNIKSILCRGKRGLHLIYVDQKGEEDWKGLKDLA